MRRALPGTKNNWEYLAGGAAIVAGGVLMATGVGGPAGLMLIGAGAATVIQKATIGDVNWGQVAVTGALGGFGGAGIAARAGFTGMQVSVVAGASSGGISGGIQNTYSYYSGPGPHTVQGGLTAVTQGAITDSVLGNGGGAAGQVGSKTIMGAVTHNPGADTMIMGRAITNRVQPYAEAHVGATITLCQTRYLTSFRSICLEERMIKSISGRIRSGLITR